MAASTSWSATPAPAHAIDTTSRVISFVLGFALASLVAWLGSIRDDLTVPPIEEQVAAAITPVVTAAAGGTTTSDTPRSRSQSVVSRGALALSSSPDGAQVVVDGEVVGETPVVLTDVPVGPRTVVVHLEGYSSWSASVRIVAGQRTTVRATLTPTVQSGSGG
jgi:hypothetical protein